MNRCLNDRSPNGLEKNTRKNISEVLKSYRGVCVGRVSIEWLTFLMSEIPDSRPTSQLRLRLTNLSHTFYLVY